MCRVSQTLLDITKDMESLDALLAAAGGEITPGTEATIDGWFAENEANLSDKVDAYCRLISEIEARAEVRKAEAKRLAERARIDENAAAALRERLRHTWEAKSLPKVQTTRYTVSLAKVGGKAKLDLRVGVEDLPGWAVTTETIVKANTDVIRDRLEAGEALDFASLMERGTRINIK
jgi:hypothetical protein